MSALNEPKQKEELFTIKIAGIVKEIFNGLKEADSINSIIFLIRLVLLLYAEDSGMIENYPFRKILLDSNDLNKAFDRVFNEIKTHPGCRYLKEYPVFKNYEIKIPEIDENTAAKIYSLLESTDFTWLHPSLFGAIFENCLSQDKKSDQGMHFTTIENIHKTIDPLFLDDLRDRAEKYLKEPLRNRNKLLKLQDELAEINILDPACGTGNFLVESYLSLRTLENKILEALSFGQVYFNITGDLPIKVSPAQFYGIEIDPVLALISESALILAEDKKRREADEFIFFSQNYTPDLNAVKVKVGNALKLFWEDITGKEKLKFIIGNPPFSGARLMNKRQKDDLIGVFERDFKRIGDLDYISGWFKKAADLMTNSEIRTAFISTNSIIQGESVGILWSGLIKSGVHIDFAYESFPWSDLSEDSAVVECVVIGFSKSALNRPKYLYSEDIKKEVSHINSYLKEGEDAFILPRSTPICPAPEIGIGNKPVDGGNFLFKKEEKDAFLKEEPEAKKYFLPFYGSQEYLRNKPRYCLYVKNIPPEELERLPKIKEVIRSVKEFRKKSKSSVTNKLALKPTEFHVKNIPEETYIAIPRVSSQKRKYLPLSLFKPGDRLFSDAMLLVSPGELWQFAILSSLLHMEWMRVVCGRLGIGYRYSKEIVYNNFPWPELSEKQKEKLIKTGKRILETREKYDLSLNELYNEEKMPNELKRAHRLNDLAVLECYGIDVNLKPEKYFGELLKLYNEQTKSPH